jgi:DNA-binding beta-propeller fold protein YncE/mono/diheme cytochrome c family protein
MKPSLTLKTAGRLPGRAVLLGVIGLLCILVGLPVLAQEPTPAPLYALPDARRAWQSSSNMIALGEDNRTLVTANMLSDSISILNVNSEAIEEIPVGRDPRSVDLTNGDGLAVVANRGDGTASIVDLETSAVTSVPLGGLWPYAVVTDEATTAYISLFGSDAVVALDLTTGTVIERYPTPDAPAGLAIWGDFLYVTHFWSGQVSLIYLPLKRVVATTSTGQDTGLSQSIEIDTTRGLAYLPQTRSNFTNTSLTFDSTAFPVVNVLDLRSFTLNREARISLATADRPVNMPLAMALDRFAERVYAVNAGSNDLSVISLQRGSALAHIELKSNPRGVILNRDSSLVYIYSAFDGIVQTLSTRDLTLRDDTPVTNIPTPVDQLLALQMFYGASQPELSADQWLSCATCHFDGLSDGRTWAGFPGGPRNTSVLFGLGLTAPYNGSGDWPDLTRVDEKIRWLQAGSGLATDQNTGSLFDIRLLVDYLNTVPAPTSSPHSASRARVEAGRALFEAQACADCHAGEAGVDGQSHEVGTGGTFDTPTLNWLWSSAPYLHDGSISTLPELFAQPGAHQLAGRLTPDEIDTLIDYLLSR